MKAVIDYGFGPLGLEVLRAWVKKDNIASQKTLESVGFEHVDTNAATGSFGYTLKRN